MEPQGKKKNARLKNWARFSGIAFEMFAVIGLLSRAGDYLDTRNQNDFPIYTLILSLIGVGASMYLVIRSVTQMGKENKEED